MSITEPSESPPLPTNIEAVRISPIYAGSPVIAIIASPAEVKSIGFGDTVISIVSEILEAEFSREISNFSFITPSMSGPSVISESWFSLAPHVSF